MSNTLTPSRFADKILHWYQQFGRKDLPWRSAITPYRVWISEIMLQQTQVKTVMPYFERFMARFSQLEDLAQASEDELLHYWTGLGYYARARNLHKAAQKIVQQYAGKFPATVEDLQNLPGIGRSTAGAILSIAFNHSAPILDANVKRVLTRYHALTEEKNQTLWSLAERYTPKKHADDYAQAMMDLGATLCVRSKPKCENCPLQKTCRAHAAGLQHTLPYKKTKPKKPLRATQLLIFHQHATHSVLMQKRPPVGIWGGLWSFPECPVEVNIVEWSERELACQIQNMQKLPTFKHVFTHFELEITPVYITQFAWQNQIRESEGWAWHSLTTPSMGGVSSPVKKLLRQLAEFDKIPPGSLAHQCETPGGNLT